MPGTIKYSSAYGTDTAGLQAAFNDLKVGDTLYIDWDYVLTSTVTFDTHVTFPPASRYWIKIVGLGEIRPQTNGMTCIQFKHTQDTLVHSRVLEGLRIVNPVAEGTGLGMAIDLASETQSIEPTNGLYHVRLKDCYIDNFLYGVRLLDAFDIVIDNCHIKGCEAAVRSELFKKGVGQLKIIGGYMPKNRYGLSIDQVDVGPDGPGHGGQGQFSVFGCTFTHRRIASPHGQIAVYVGKPFSGIYLFGNSFEDVANAVYIDPAIPEYPDEPPMVLAAVGNSFLNMDYDPAQGPGWWIDTRYASGAAGHPSMGAVAVVGNTASHNGGTRENLPPMPALVNIAKVLDNGKGGVLLAGNAFNPYPPFEPSIPNNAYPKEKSSQFYPLPAYTNTKPSAATLPPGFAIYYTSTNAPIINKILTSDGTNWRDANGNIVP